MVEVEVPADWELRLTALWAGINAYDAKGFIAHMQSLVAELPCGNAIALFELASANDTMGREKSAESLYRQALAAGLSGIRRRRATIQLASTLRNLGEAAEGVLLLEAERARGSDALDDALDAFLALCLDDTGRSKEALALALAALSHHLPRYNRSLANYAKALVDDE